MLEKFWLSPVYEQFFFGRGETLAFAERDVYFV
jgi:hypothetical protein